MSDEDVADVIGEGVDLFFDEIGYGEDFETEDLAHSLIRALKRAGYRIVAGAAASASG